MLSHRLGLFPLRWDVRIRLSGSAQLLQQHCETSAGSPKIRSQKKPQPLRCWLEGGELGWEHCSHILGFWVCGCPLPGRWQRSKCWMLCTWQGRGEGGNAWIFLNVGVIPKIFGLRRQGETCGCWGAAPHAHMQSLQLIPASQMQSVCWVSCWGLFCPDPVCWSQHLSPGQSFHLPAGR